MVDVKICACGIAAADCDYHKPEEQEYISFKVETQVDYVYQGNGIWTVSLNPPPPLNTGAAAIKRSAQDNPFLTNDMTKRADYMRANPNTWPSAVRDAGLLAPWELQKT